MRRIILLTGSELRHDFFRKLMAADSRFEVLSTYCEGQELSARSLLGEVSEATRLRDKHLRARTASERDFFSVCVRLVEDKSRPRLIPKGAINDPAHVDEIVSQRPDLLISYGCSLITSSLLQEFEGRFLNVHLGLSPYYRGVATNFWPLVNGEPECVGATFMHIDSGIDTGAVLHQIRAKYEWGDTPSQVGNRLILEMTRVFGEIVAQFDKLSPPVTHDPKYPGRLYRRKDYSEESVAKVYENFRHGLVEDYLENAEARDQKTPILTNAGLVL